MAIIKLGIIGLHFPFVSNVHKAEQRKVLFLSSFYLRLVAVKEDNCCVDPFCGYILDVSVSWGMTSLVLGHVPIWKRTVCGKKKMNLVSVSRADTYLEKKTEDEDKLGNSI